MAGTGADPHDEDAARLVDSLLRLPRRDGGRTARDLARSIAAAAEPGRDLALKAALETLEARSFDLSRIRRSAKDTERLAAALEILDAFRDHALPAFGVPPPDTATEINSELDALVVLARGDAVDQALSLQAQTRGVAALRLLAMASHPPSPDRPGFLLGFILATRSGAHEGRSTGVTAEGNISQARALAFEGLEKAALALEGESRRSFLLRLADDVIDHGEDAVARAEGLPGTDGIGILDLARADIESVAALKDAVGMRFRSRGLRRARNRLRAIAEDRQVRSRHEKIVGARAARILDFVTLGLVVTILLILATFAFFNLSERSEEILDGVDTGVCVLLLFEFGWRWSLARFRPRYLFRHLLTDVLPSIPYGPLAAAIRATAAAESVQALQLVRLARVAEALRLLRPLVQTWRLLAFSLHGMDRFARRHAPLLNRNFVLFDEPDQAETGAATPAARLLHLYERTARAFRQSLEGLPAAQRDTLFSERLEAIRARHEQAPACNLGVPGIAAGHKDVRVESLIERLVTLDHGTVKERLGVDETRRWARFLAFLDAPIIRRLPILSRIVPGLSRVEPAEAVVRAGRAAGLALDTWLDRVRAAADLKGIVTGPQLLDRLGNAIVKMTQRPAARLILLGFIALLVGGAIGLLGLNENSPLQKLHRLLKNFLGTPLLVLGGICLVFQAFGRWIRHLAGSATDFLEKVAEAHGIDLLKYRKYSFKERDLGLLFDRALEPEIEARTTADPATIAVERKEFIETTTSAHQGPGPSLMDAGHLREQVSLFYFDYLDGGILHHSNVKSVEQFLGNLDIESIRNERLRMTRKERGTLKRLDVQKERALPTGPYLWFTFIVESLSQKTARLILDYNRHAIAISHLEFVAAERVAEFKRWLDESKAPGFRPGVVSTSASLPFTALHFVDADPGRDQSVREVYGERVVERLRRDRRDLIRSVFTSYPCSRWPRHRRILNPYALYFRWLGHGRILVLPIRIAFQAVLLLARTIRFISGVIKEQISPTGLDLSTGALVADRDSALRKINRMHRPLFLAALDLRTRFDPEYLGIPLPGAPSPDPSLAALSQDLDLVGAPEYEREGYRDRRSATAHLVARFSDALEELEWPVLPLEAALDPDRRHGTAGTQREALRAVVIAYVIDYQDVRSLLHAEEDIASALESARDNPEAVRRRGLRFPRLPSRPIQEYLGDQKKEGLATPEISRLRGLLSADWLGAGTRLLLVARNGGFAKARDSARRILAGIARCPTPWSQQVVTLRSVQTMTCLDILTTRSMVMALGEFDAGEAPQTFTAPVS